MYVPFDEFIGFIYLYTGQGPIIAKYQLSPTCTLLTHIYSLFFLIIKRHDIAEILQTLTLNTNQSISLIIEITCRFV
jgi:hypothetical protein